ncbi:MAG: AsmA-like C-terminal region-containing protein, partial [Cryomorphaceae bacterium]
MKKALKVIGIIVLLFLAALIILPIALKGKIVELVKKEANANLNAVVDFSDVNLSLIRNFPNLSVKIESLSVIGVAPFEGDTLAYMDDLALTVDVMSAISGDQIEIITIDLHSPVINVKVLEDGSANYDIAKESTEEEAPDPDEAEGEAVNLQIRGYSITDGRVVYDDVPLGFYILLDGLDHQGNGNFAEEIFTLRTESQIETVDVVYDGIKYLRRAKADLKADIDMDFEKFKFTFKENELDVNSLALGFDGWLAMPGDDIDMDITFKSLKSDLVTILSLVPSDYTEDLEGVDATGMVSLTGFVKGVYNDNSMPGYGLDLLVENGRVQYPDLPRSIENINIETAIKSPEGNDMDLLTVDVSRFYMEIGKTATHKNTVDAVLSLRNPMSDPKIDTRVDADLDLGSFKDVIPMEEDFDLKGVFAAHFALKGALSDIENQRFNEFTAKGAMELTGMEYKDAEMAVKIPEARADFTPQRLNVDQFRVTYDQINMAMDGFVDNYVAYALTDTTLHGVFNFTADRIDANKYMTETEGETEEEVEAETEAELSVIEVPANLDLTLNATIGEVLYDEIVMKNIAGQITVREQRATLKNLSIDALDGQIILDGYYTTVDPAVPEMSFSYDIRNLNLKQTAEAFSTIEKMAPIAKQASGNFSSKFDLTTSLDEKLEPVYETMQGGGTFQSANLVLEGGDFLQKLATTMKSPKLARQEIRDLKVSFAIADGKVTTSPFDVKINQMSANVSGYTSFEQEIEYLMKMKV